MGADLLIFGGGSPLFALEYPTLLPLSSSVSSSSSAPMPSLWLWLHTALSQGVTAVYCSLKAKLSQLSALLIAPHPICSPSPAVCRTSLLPPSACWSFLPPGLSSQFYFLAASMNPFPDSCRLFSFLRAAAHFSALTALTVLGGRERGGSWPVSSVLFSLLCPSVALFC